MVGVLFFFFFFFRQKTAYEISTCLVGSEMYMRERCVRGIIRSRLAFIPVVELCSCCLILIRVG